MNNKKSFFLKDVAFTERLLNTRKAPKIHPKLNKVIVFISFLPFILQPCLCTESLK